LRPVSFIRKKHIYKIVVYEDIDELVVNEINLGTFIASSDSFIVSQQFRDGFEIRFGALI